MRNKKNILLAVVILLAACKEKYLPPTVQPNTGYLVVEGFINSGTGPTVINLSRTIKLSDTSIIRREAKAIVRVEAKSGATTVLPETSLGSGTYSGTPVINPGDQYRVSITTSAGRAYVSDYSDVRKTVNIDTLRWEHVSDGVHFYVNTHDPSNSTRYYRYSFDETWEFHSPYQVFLKLFFVNGQVDHAGWRDSARFTFDSLVWKCWKTFNSPDIQLINTEKLSEDKVLNFPIEFIENSSWKLSVLYTMNLKQYAMSRDGYRYFEQLKKNTQQLGTIFDSQPSDNLGNMHCINDANEPVVGFVEVTEEKQKRIWISNDDVRPWIFNRDCPEVAVVNNKDSLKSWQDPNFWVPTRSTNPSGPIAPIGALYFTSYQCATCTAFGSNVRPSFWPR